MRQDMYFAEYGDHTSLSTMMNCPCDRYDDRGRPKIELDTDWLP